MAFSWESFWRSSGEIVEGLQAGNYEIEFKPVGGCRQPDNRVIVLAPDVQTVTNLSYACLGESSLGLLRVELFPEAIRGQARWRVQGQNWQASGATTNLSEGVYLLDFSSVPEYDAAAAGGAGLCKPGEQCEHHLLLQRSGDWHRGHAHPAHAG